MSPCWILTTARTGSSFLCEILNQTGLFVPEFKEYMHPEAKPFEFVQRPYCKVMRGHFERFLHDGAKEDIERLFPGMKYIYLNRQNIEDKAVSLYFARETGVWCLRREDREQYMAQPVHLDENKLMDAYHYEARVSRLWDNFLEGTPHLRIEYEELVESPAEVIRKVLTYLGYFDEIIARCPLVPMRRPETESFLNHLKVMLTPPPEPEPERPADE